MANSNIKTIKSKNLTWVDVSACRPLEMKKIEKEFNIHLLHIEDCLSPIQSPKVDVAPQYLFMVLLFPVYDRKTRKINSSEIDFFINSNTLITVHRGELSPLMNFFNLCQTNEEQKEKYFIGSPALLIYEILRRLFESCSPILGHINLNINKIEENIFKGYEKKMVREILIAKTNIVNFRRITQAHRIVIRKLLKKSSIFFSPGQLKIYFQEVIETAADIWDSLENLKQTIEAIEQTNNSLISFQLSDIIKILTIISIIVLPISLVTNTFGMNLKFMPLINDPFGFWALLGLMILLTIILISYFRKKQWF
jgi:magnesium transporter